MNNKKSTKRALLTSVLSMVLCLTMLIGTTFAWFTDEVSSTGNIIQSGNLKVSLEYKDLDDTDYADASTGAIFDYKLWEPGYTDVKTVKVSNEGNLALKYRLDIIPNVQPVAGEVNLADVIDVYVINGAVAPANFTEIKDGWTNAGTLTSLMADADGAAHGALLPTGTDAAKATEYAKIESAEITIALHMKETAENEYQNCSVGDGFSVRLYATQYTHEEDSFDNTYDANAEYSYVPTAAITSLDPTTVSGDGKVEIYDVNSKQPTGSEVTIDVAYMFKSEEFDTAQNSPYAEWITDYVISFDKEVKAGSAGLAGYYGNFGITDWIAFTAPTDVPANEEIALLKSLLGQEIAYKHICRDVNEFQCGAFNLDPENVGTTMTVELRLTNPEDVTDYVVAGLFEYTFK